MRDDIYRLVSLPPILKRVVRACQPDADWKVEGAIKAEAALRQILADEIRPELAQEVGRILGGSQRSIAPRADLERLRTEHTRSSLERLFLDHVLINAQASDATALGIKGALEERLNSYQQSFERELLQRAPRDAAAMTDRYRESFEAVPVEAMARDFLRGNMTKTPQRQRPHLHADDDIVDLSFEEE